MEMLQRCVNNIVSIDEFEKLLNDEDMVPFGSVWNRIWTLNPHLRNSMRKYGREYKEKQINKCTIELKSKFKILEPLIQHLYELKKISLDQQPNFVASVGVLLNYIESKQFNEPDNIFMRLASSPQNLILIEDDVKNFPIKPNWRHIAIERGFIILRFDIEKDESLMFGI